MEKLRTFSLGEFHPQGWQQRWKVKTRVNRFSNKCRWWWLRNMEISHLMALITSRLNAPEPMIRLVGEALWNIFWGGFADYHHIFLMICRTLSPASIRSNLATNAECWKVVRPLLHLLVQLNHLSKDKAWLDENHLLPNGSALKSLNRIPMIESKISGAVLFNNNNNNNNNSTLVRETWGWY